MSSMMTSVTGHSVASQSRELQCYLRMSIPISLLPLACPVFSTVPIGYGYGCLLSGP